MKTGRCVRCPRTNSAPLLGSRLMGKRRADADGRRFFDEFLCVKIPRMRATGVLQLDAPHTIIQFDDRRKLIGLAHVRFRNGGSWSLFRCPKCGRRANRLWLIEDRTYCVKCCSAIGVQHRSSYGFGRTERLRARDRALDELQAKLETSEPFRLNGAPASWGGRAQQVYRSRRLTQRMRRSMIVLRLNQLASQQANDIGGLDIRAPTSLAEPRWRQSQTSSQSGKPTQPNTSNKP